MSTHDINRSNYNNTARSIREQNQRRKDIERLTRRHRTGKTLGGIAVGAVIVGIAGFNAFHVSEPKAGAVKLPNITTEQGRIDAEKGVAEGNLVTVDALLPTEKLDLKGTNLTEQPNSFSAIAADSTESPKGDYTGILSGLVYNEANTAVAQPFTTYYVPTTSRSLELHKLEEKSGYL
jgi:hypothetical protein